mmetsp:Transcript_6073/g.17294  ORF Transcript_6073/g.17294 Transcript_6073/m.17294 type:complete len:584 (-) Transcript_6073:199-1950(-)
MWAPGLTSLDSTHELTLQAIRSLECSATLADPNIADCPLIGCSEGFERLTGYCKSEVIGQNCRFLNKGIVLDERLRKELHEAALFGTRFMGVLPNKRKSGEQFDNFLRLTALTVRGRLYLLGVQADVTHVQLDLSDLKQLEELERIGERIFAAHIESWVLMQSHDFIRRLPDQLVRDTVKAVHGDFVVLDQNPCRVPYGGVMECKNTFLNYREVSTGELRRNLSAPCLAVHALQCMPNDEGDESTRDEVSEGASSSSGSICSPSSSCPPPDLGRWVPQGAEILSVSSASGMDFGSGASSRYSSGCGSASARRGASCWLSAEDELRLGGRSLGSNKSATAETDMDATAAAESSVGFESSSSSSAPLSCARPSASRHEAASVTRVSWTASGSSASSSASSSSTLPPPLVTSITSAALVSTTVARPSFAGEPTDHGERSSVVRLTYPGIRPRRTGGPPDATLAVYQRVCFPALIEAVGVSAELQSVLLPALSFSVDPPLPPGLRIDTRNGTVHGVAVRAHRRLLHVVTVHTQGFGPGGVELGLVPIATCPFSLHVVDLSRLAVSRVHERGSDENTLLVEFELPPER